MPPDREPVAKVDASDFLRPLSTELGSGTGPCAIPEVGDLYTIPGSLEADSRN